jgi:hypothetical protein
MSTTEELEARIVALEAQQATQSEALRYLSEGRWIGDMPHAAAFIASLYGADGPPDYAPVEYPPKDW